MIMNERQYLITKSQVKRFEQALTEKATRTGQVKQVHPLLEKAQMDGLQSQLFELRGELEEYEALRSGKHKVFKLKSFEEIPRALIMARIALGLTQKDLAERLGIKEQQIQRYEATEYASASLERIKAVISALNIKVQEEVFLPTVNPTLDILFKKMEKVGLDKEFVMKRLLPPDLFAYLETREKGEGKSDVNNLLIKGAQAIGRVFGWTSEMIFGPKSLHLETFAVDEARFKAGAREKKPYTGAYVVYAHFLALLALEATPELKRKKIIGEANDFRNAVITAYGSISFEHVLDYVWNLGVPVLPLNDSGAFHGACWRVNSRNVIVLKQGTRSNARWLFDLLHEVWHIAQESDQADLTVIESSDAAKERKNSLDEQRASQFAGNVILAGRAEELAELCVNAARKSVERLKAIVPKTATQNNVATDSLANYMAFRLSLQGINWWGAAANLQETEEDPWKIARDSFLTRSTFGRLNESDRSLLVQALSDVES